MVLRLLGSLRAFTSPHREFRFSGGPALIDRVGLELGFVLMLKLALTGSRSSVVSGSRRDARRRFHGPLVKRTKLMIQPSVVFQSL